MTKFKMKLQSQRRANLEVRIGYSYAVRGHVTRIPLGPGFRLSWRVDNQKEAQG